MVFMVNNFSWLWLDFYICWFDLMCLYVYSLKLNTTLILFSFWSSVKMLFIKLEKFQSFFCQTHTQLYFALPFSTPYVRCSWWWSTVPQSHAYFSLCVWGWGISIDLALGVLNLLSSISNLLSTCSSNCVPRLPACSINPFPSLHLVFFSLNYNLTFYILYFEKS